MKQVRWCFTPTNFVQIVLTIQLLLFGMYIFLWSASSNKGWVRRFHYIDYLFWCYILSLIGWILTRKQYFFWKNTDAIFMHKFIECTDFTVSSQLGYAHMQYNVICYIVSSPSWLCVVHKNFMFAQGPWVQVSPTYASESWGERLQRLRPSVQWFTQGQTRNNLILPADQKVASAIQHYGITCFSINGRKSLRS